MTPLRPLFEGPAAAASTSVLAAAGPAPRIDLDVLARLLCVPAVDGEYQPGAPWVGVRRLRATPDTPGRGSLGAGAWQPRVRDAFDRALAETLAGHRTVAVSLSGGLDSLAVLLGARALLGAAAVHAITLDLGDDDGRRAGDVAAAQLAALAPDCPHTVLSPNPSPGPDPRPGATGHGEGPAATGPPSDSAGELADELPWDPTGPRLDAMPELNATVNAAAAAVGATLLLSGDGADEHLAVPRYATALVAATHGPGGAARYLRDLYRIDTGITGELLAVAAGVLPRSQRTGLYWAANWPQWCHPEAPAVIAEPYRERASAWARAQTTSARRDHVSFARSWAEADAFDAVHPHDPIPSAGPVPEASPFLAGPMLAAATRLGLAQRYDPRGASAYQRAKAPVMALLADAEPSALPRAKQHYSQAITSVDQAPVAVPELHRVGVSTCARLDATNSDPALRRAARAVEAWLRGARTRGHHP